MEISITIDPKLLANPDADLRYDIPDRIEEVSDAQIEGDGYDYDDEQNMIIFLQSEGISEERVISFIETALLDFQISPGTVQIDLKH